MSEPIPESIPTSADPKSKRPTKRRALTPGAQHANQVSALFAKPDREIVIPDRDALSKKDILPPPPEIVANVQGSSAGAGSGEFHVYKASRRREYERVKRMDEAVAKEKADADFESQQTERKRKDEERTSKNRKKREKIKLKKGKAPPADITQPVVGGEQVAGEEVKQMPERVGITIHDEDLLSYPKLMNTTRRY